jgi:arylsulfatase A-like enzyme
VAPTLLDLVGMAKPSTMTGQSLLEAEMRLPRAGIGS